MDAIVPAGGAAIYDYRVSCVSVIGEEEEEEEEEGLFVLEHILGEHILE